MIADRTRGLITITDVDVVDDEAGGHHVLRFRCGGEPREWRITHDEDEDEEEFDAVMTFSMRIHELVPAGSPARWCAVEINDGAYGPQAVFGDPEAMRQPVRRFSCWLPPSPRWCSPVPVRPSPWRRPRAAPR
ncbi:hypothetical protein WEI85_33320 [Actinomycetes bacterium KLBMP 9797]